MSQDSSWDQSFLRRILPNAGWLGMAPLVSKLLGIAILPVMTFYLSPQDYGVLAITALVVALLSALGDWGQGVGLTRNFFDYVEGERGRFLFSVMAAVAGTTTILWGGAAIFGPVVVKLAVPDWEPQYAFYLRLHVLSGAIVAMEAVGLNYLMVSERARELGGLRLAIAVLGAGLQVLLLAGFGLGLLAVYYTNIVSALAGMVFVIWLLRDDFEAGFRWGYVREVFRTGWAALPTSVIGYLVRVGDRWILQALLPLNALGLYSFGAKFEDLYQTYNTAMKGAWKPANLRLLSQEASHQRLINHANYLLEISTVVAVGLILFSQEGIRILATQQFHEAYVVVPFLVVGGFMRALSIIPYNRLIHEKRVPLALVALLPTAVVGLGLAWLLIPRYGIVGAAFASMAGWGTNFVIHSASAALATGRKLPVSIPHWTVFALLIALAAGVTMTQPGNSVWGLLAVKASVFLLAVATVGFMEREKIWAFARQLGTGK